MFKLTSRVIAAPAALGFNPLIGILFVQAATVALSSNEAYTFQSPDRDSVCSSGARQHGGGGAAHVSIP